MSLIDSKFFSSPLHFIKKKFLTHTWFLILFSVLTYVLNNLDGFRLLKFSWKPDLCMGFESSIKLSFILTKYHVSLQILVLCKTNLRVFLFWLFRSFFLFSSNEFSLGQFLDFFFFCYMKLTKTWKLSKTGLTRLSKNRHDVRLISECVLMLRKIENVASRNWKSSRKYLRILFIFAFTCVLED